MTERQILEVNQELERLLTSLPPGTDRETIGLLAGTKLSLQAVLIDLLRLFEISTRR